MKGYLSRKQSDRRLTDIHFQCWNKHMYFQMMHIKFFSIQHSQKVILNLQNFQMIFMYQDKKLLWLYFFPNIVINLCLLISNLLQELIKMYSKWGISILRKGKKDLTGIQKIIFMKKYSIYNSLKRNAS